MTRPPDELGLKQLIASHPGCAPDAVWLGLELEVCDLISASGTFPQGGLLDVLELLDASEAMSRTDAHRIPRLLQTNWEDLSASQQATVLGRLAGSEVARWDWLALQLLAEILSEHAPVELAVDWIESHATSVRDEIRAFAMYCAGGLLERGVEARHRALLIQLLERAARSGSDLVQAEAQLALAKRGRGHADESDR